MARDIRIRCIAGLGLAAYSYQGPVPTKETLQLIVGDTLSLQFALFREGESDIEGVALSAVTGARVIIRDSRSPAGQLYAYSDTYTHTNQSFPVTGGTTNADRFTFAQLALTDSDLLTDVDAAGATGLECWLEFSTTSSTGEDTWLQTQCTIYPDVYRSGSPTPTPEPDYYTAAEVQALAQVHYDSVAVDLTTPDVVDLVTVPTGKVFVLQSLLRYNSAVTTPGTPETIKVGTSLDDDAAVGATPLSYASQGAIDQLLLTPLAVAAGGIVRVTITAGATSAAATGRYVALGLLIPA